MRLCRKVDNKVRIVLLNQPFHKFPVADISLHENVSLIMLNALKILEIAAICKLIKIYEQYVVILLKHIIYKIAADKAGTAGYKIFSHGYPLKNMSLNFVYCLVYHIWDKNSILLLFELLTSLGDLPAIFFLLKGYG